MNRWAWGGVLVGCGLVLGACAPTVGLIGWREAESWWARRSVVLQGNRVDWAGIERPADRVNESTGLTDHSLDERTADDAA